MTKRTLTIIAVVALVALAAVPLAYAQAGRHARLAGFGGGFGFFGHLRHLKTALDLSDQQVDQIQAIAKEMHQQNAQYRDQLHGGLKSVAQALINNPNDVAGAQAILDQQSAAENAMKHNALAAASKALNVLTPDQRAKLGTMLSEHMAAHRH